MRSDNQSVMDTVKSQSVSWLVSPPVHQSVSQTVSQKATTSLDTSLSFLSVSKGWSWSLSPTCFPVLLMYNFYTVLRLGHLCSDASDFSNKSETMCQFLKKCDYPALSSKPNIYIPAQMVSMFCASDSKSATTLLNTPLVLHNIALRIENLHKCLINSVICLKWDRKTQAKLSIVVENRQIILWSAISC